MASIPIENCTAKLNPHGHPRVSPDVWGSVLLWALHVYGTTETTRLGQIAACIGICKIRKPCSTISQLQAPFIYLKPRPCLSIAGHAPDQQHTTRHHERSKLEGNVPQSQQLIAVYRYRHNPSFVHRRHYCEILSTQDSFQSLETLLSSSSALRMDERKYFAQTKCPSEVVHTSSTPGLPIRRLNVSAGDVSIKISRLP